MVDCRVRETGDILWNRVASAESTSFALPVEPDERPLTLLTHSDGATAAVDKGHRPHACHASRRQPAPGQSRNASMTQEELDGIADRAVLQMPQVAAAAAAGNRPNSQTVVLRRLKSEVRGSRPGGRERIRG